MTFIVNDDGVVYQKGTSARRLEASPGEMKGYSPRFSGWEKVVDQQDEETAANQKTK